MTAGESATAASQEGRARQILESRARLLAQDQEGEERTTGSPHVVFGLNGEAYAVDARRVIEVRPLADRSRVPNVPGFVVGAINVRGVIYSVIDIRPFLGLAGEPMRPASSWALLVEGAGMRVGLQVERIEGIILVDTDRLEPPPRSGGGAGEWITGVTPEAQAVLDVEALLAMPGIVIEEAT